MATPEYVIVGLIRRAHGIRGELVVEALTDEPAAVFAAGRRVLVGTAGGDPVPDGRELAIDEARAFKGELFIVQFAGIPDRTAADAWRDRYLLVPAAELTPPTEGQAYLHELPGMEVVLETGELIGLVREVYELRQGYMVDVARDRGTVMVPLQDQFVIEVNREGRRITVSLPEGLLE